MKLVRPERKACVIKIELNLVAVSELHLFGHGRRENFLEEEILKGNPIVPY